MEILKLSFYSRSIQELGEAASCCPQTASLDLWKKKGFDLSTQHFEPCFAVSWPNPRQINGKCSPWQKVKHECRRLMFTLLLSRMWSETLSFPSQTYLTFTSKLSPLHSLSFAYFCLQSNKMFSRQRQLHCSLKHFLFSTLYISNF